MSTLTTHAQHATERLRDDDGLSNTLSYPTPRCAKFGPREGTLCMRHVCGALSTLAAPILRGTISLVEHEVRAFLSVRETPLLVVQSLWTS